ncbi:hypothetical protein [Intestinimonas butyriciproducens]|uniref:hypothetical protein n=1 Tax=Intestinimonas butyriciproducens TaxID=1297617 RepID=UPI00195B13E2|nr:hypothetical protein [Intestinimonas butyriciproducens]MBM6975883.1 hypothetical protein [Intestinimonas butyriciproducens]
MDSMSVGRYAPCYYIDMESKTLTRGTYDFSALMEKRAKMAEEEARNPQIGRETLSRQELEDMAAKYDPSHMSQETYNAFIRDLLDQGVLGKSETYDIGLDRVVIRPGQESLIEVGSGPEERVRTLAEAGGDALRWAEITLRRCSPQLDPIKANAIEKVYQILKEMDELRR